MQKWGYCRLMTDSNISGICWFTNNGPDLVWYHKLFGDNNPVFREILKRHLPGLIIPENEDEFDSYTFKDLLIAALGKLGWEMVGYGTISRDTESIYFKRPI